VFLITSVRTVFAFANQRSLFAGQTIGSAGGAKVFLEVRVTPLPSLTRQYGWRPASALNLGLIGLAVLILLARGPNATGWIGGWHRGFRPVRAQPVPAADVEKAPPSPPLADEKPPSS